MQKLDSRLVEDNTEMERLPSDSTEHSVQRGEQSSMHQRKASLPMKMAILAAHPLSVLWLLMLVAAMTGSLGWLFFDHLPWEGLGAAFTIAGVTKIAANAKGVRAWPWEEWHRIDQGGETGV